MAIYNDMSFNAYRALPGWNWSKIKLLVNGSPKHVKHAVETEDDGDTTDRLKLRAVHTMTLEPHNFERDYLVYDGPLSKATRSTKAYKTFVAENGGKHVLLPADVEEIKATAAAYRAHPVVAEFLADGKPEVTLTWTHPATGLPCKGRLDWLHPTAIVDLKGIGTTNPRQVGSMVAKNLYHGQLAHYREGAEQNGLGELTTIIAAAEGKDAQDVGAFDLRAGVHGSAFHEGQILRERLMERLAEAVNTNHWPGCVPSIERLDLPMWARDKSGDDFDFYDEVM